MGIILLPLTACTSFYCSCTISILIHLFCHKLIPRTTLWSFPIGGQSVAWYPVGPPASGATQAVFIVVLDSRSSDTIITAKRDPADRQCGYLTVAKCGAVETKMRLITPRRQVASGWPTNSPCTVESGWPSEGVADRRGIGFLGWRISNDIRMRKLYCFEYNTST